MSLLHAGQQPPEQSDESPASALGLKLLSEFQEAEKAKRLVEPRLLQCLRQYKGVYDPEVKAKIKRGRSTAFIRHTAAKVDTTKARLMDLLFPSNGALNYEISPSPQPRVAPAAVQAYVAELQAKGESPPADQDKLVMAVATRASELMSKKIADQLMEPHGNASYPRVCDRVILSGLMYGTGIHKGPLVSRKDQQRYVLRQDGQWIRQPVEQGDEYKPFFTSVSVWNFFPDPSATSPEDLMHCWEEHVLTRADFLALGKNPGFNAEAIRGHIEKHNKGDANLTQRQTEVMATSKEEGSTGASTLTGRYRALERWGYLDGNEVLAAGISPEDINAAFPEGFDTAGAYSACVWITNDGTVLKASLAPIEGVAIPYNFFQPYKDESSFWAEGLCDRIRDPQVAINAMARMTMDHASITTLPQVAVNVSALAANQGDPTDFTAGKAWLFEDAESMDRCMRMYEINSHIPEILAIGEKFSQWSDETSSPRYMSGDNAGVRGAGDTAAGLSMLMGAASLPSKDMVRQFDALTEQFITNIYDWNMKFSPDPRIKGDFDIIARGSTALIAQELQGRRTLEVMSILATPLMEKRVDFDFVLKHILHYMSLPEGIRMDPEKVKEREFEEAKMMQAAQIAALIEEAQKQGIPPQTVLLALGQQAAQAGVQQQPQSIPQNTGMDRIPTPQEVPLG